ncbi:ATP-binding protein [Streptomyces cavernicola]|uniref:ATP-binding protein n=1 Tax=Streptomyces cavernicola TaxID=3043613 RepID=A0ABT6SLP9_9ACTN|nr:ATP-binding protein [Streptomyces sp. B-S-A6]MDI3409113.1 ATP-binding protein [Streptomyces sp. B-S-A6]
MVEVSQRLPRTPRSATRARALLREQLTEWGIKGELMDTAELLLSELVANAVQHAPVPAGRDIGLRVGLRNGRVVRIEVSDAGDGRPVPRQAGPEDEQGRGLALVGALADRWGCSPRPYGIGKAVWVELELPGGGP